MFNCLKNFWYALVIIVGINTPACKNPEIGSKRFQGGGQVLQESQSGVWSGYWIQNGQKGEMNLDIKIADFKITGDGQDLVGPFLLQGEYDENGMVEIRKQYLQQHEVVYRGTYKDNVISGNWYIQNRDSVDTGTYVISWSDR